MEDQFQVGVICLTYNHSAYIEETMNGFTMQQTCFPYICCIIDDASTDGEPEVIRQYLEKDFDLEDKLIARHEETDDYTMLFARHKKNQNCFFVVFLLKYNHNSIKKSKFAYISEWTNSKYTALCEGDDYWISGDKLQMQISFLENHTDYTMTCCRAKRYSQSRKEYVEDLFCYEQSQNVKVEDVILRGGGFIPTCSIVYRSYVKQNYPEYCLKCHVGDYPLQIMSAMKGKVYYDNNAMVVYRVDNPNSWTAFFGGVDYKKKLDGIRSQFIMFDGFAKDYPQYSRLFFERTNNILILHVPIKLIQQRKYQYFRRLFRKWLHNMDDDNKRVLFRNSSPIHRFYKYVIKCIIK